MPRFFRIIAPAALLCCALAAVFWGLTLGGAANPRVLGDPGAVVRFGLPLLRTIVNMAIATLLGAMVLACWAFSPARREYRIALDLAAASSALLTIASLATLIFTFMDVSGLPFSVGGKFGAALAQFSLTIELGQLWLWEVLLAAAATALALAIRSRKLAIILLIIALATILPLAQQGHAAGTAGHSQAVNSLLVHLLAAGVWIGGLVTIVAVSPAVSRERLSALVRRYSSLALLAFFAVAASGVVSGMLRVGTVQELFGSDYGKLLILKTVTLLLLGAFGVLQRAWLIPKIAASRGGSAIFAWFVVAEFTVMGVASGIAGALGRTATPVDFAPAREIAGSTPAEILSGDPLPGEFVPASIFSAWKFDSGWTLICLLAAIFYVAGVWRLHHRGDHWPPGRLIAWLAGVLLLFYTTNGALNAYEQYLFSVHMLGHMMLTMLIPLLLVLGAPVTLLMRTVAKRRDGSWGAREWVMWLVQSPWSKIVSNPIVAAFVFVGSLWVFYFTQIFRWVMAEHWGHQWMIVHFLISGYLFSLSMIGVDPVPKRFPFPLRLVTLFATMAGHAFFGVTIMTGKSLLLSDWFGAMGRTWGADPLADQVVGGGIAWGIGEIPTLLLALAVAMQWSRSDAKEQKRKDRAAERSGEAELQAYNDMLQKRAARR